MYHDPCPHNAQTMHDDGDFRAEFLGAVLVLKDDDAWRDALLSGQALKGAKGMCKILLAWLLKLESPWDQYFGSLLASRGDHKAVRCEILFERILLWLTTALFFHPPRPIMHMRVCVQRRIAYRTA